MRERARHAILSTYQDATAAMNRGHRLAASTDQASLEAAIEAYSQSIQILDTLESAPDNNNSLGAALMNRGQITHQLFGTEKAEYALSDYEKATTLLELCSETDSPWPRRNRVGTLLNHANLLLDLGRFHEAKEKAETALNSYNLPNPIDPTDCELSILAARVYCDAIGQLLPSLSPEDQTDLANQAGERVDEALTHIRCLRPRFDHEPFPEASDRLFRFGCLLHAAQNPKKLNTFIQSHLANLQDPQIRTQFHTTAKQAIKAAVQSISNDLLKPTTTPEEQDKLTLCTQTLAALFTRLSTH